MFEQIPTAGPGVASATTHTFEILFMLLTAFLLGLTLGYVLWSRYREKLSELANEKKGQDSQVQNLIQEIATIKGQNKSVEKNHTILSFKYEELEKQNSGLQARHDSMQLNTERLRTRMEVAADEASQYKAKHEELQHLNNNLQTELGSLAKEHDFLKENARKIQRAYDETKKEYNVLNKQHKAQIAELVSLQKMHGKVLNELDHIKMSGEQLNTDQLKLVENYDNLQKEFEDHHKNHATTIEENLQLKADLEAAKANNEEISKTNRALESRFKQLEEDYNKLESNLGQIGKSYGSLRGEHSELNSLYDAQKEEYESLNGAYAGLRSEMEELGKKYAGLKGEHEEMGRSHISLKAELEVLKENLTTIKAKNVELGKNYAGLKGEYEALEEVNNKLKTDYKDINNQFHMVRGELKNQEEAKSLIDKEYEELTMVYDQLKNQEVTPNQNYESLKKRYAKLDKSNETIIRINNKLQNSLSDAESMIDDLQSEKERLTARLSALENKVKVVNTDKDRSKILGKKVEDNDMKIIEGIGPRIESLLYKANIRTWQELADSNVEKLQSILDKAGSRYNMHDPASWPQQALFAAEKRWEKLKEYQNYLRGGEEEKGEKS